MFYSIITSLVGIVFPYITGNFADQLISAGDNQFIVRYILVFSGFGIFSLISGYISQCIYVKLQSRMAYEMGRDVIAHIQRVSLDFMQGKSAGYLNQQINNDTNSVIIFCISILQQIIVQAGLKSEIVIPDGVTKIGKQAFYNCEGLTKITFNGGGIIGAQAIHRTMYRKDR